MTATAPGPGTREEPLLEANGMRKHFTAGGGLRQLASGASVHAVDDVSIAVRPGEIVAVVGESGSGKSTLGRLLSRLEVPTEGELLLHGKPVPKRGTRPLRAFRREVQVVFQDPYASLNPSHTVGYHLQRPLAIHGRARTRAEARRLAIELLERVHLAPGEQFIDRYPQQLSGGQRQRVAIARALASDPSMIVADEPVASLDVSSRLTILNLFAEIAHSGASLLYITHDIASARYFADRIVVMYAGQLVEQGEAEALVSHPMHPYSKLLISSAPDPDRRGRDDESVADAGSTPSLVAPPSGCRFHPRCPHAMAICSAQEPKASTEEAGRTVNCWLFSAKTRSEQSAATATDHD